MKKRYKIMIIAGVLFVLTAVGVGAYVKSVMPPGEEWIAYRNEEVIASIDRQLKGLDMERILQKEADVLEKDVAGLQEAVRSGQLTYEEITAIYLYRIKTLDQREHGFNSVTEVAPDAVQQARERDQERQAATELAPLFGIPVMLKDNINASGMSAGAGAEAFADYMPKEDAQLVRTLREQGAVILGKNNLSEFANYVSSIMPSGYSGKKGQTVNPFGPLKITPSGSSSGSAVAVAANLTAISIGTETAGSIMGPASANSVVGFKPTRDKVSNEGILPLIKKVDTAGPLAKTVEDAALAYAAISGETVAKLDRSALNGAVIGLISYSYDDEKTLEMLRTALAEAGAQVVDITLNEEGVQVQNIISLSFGQDFEEFAQKYGLPLKKLSDLVAYNQEDPKRRVRYGQDYLEAAAAVKQPDAAQIGTSIQKARAELDRAFAGHGLDAVVFLKTSASTSVAAAGYPELNVPFGADAKGRPQGVTFGGQYSQDQKLLDLGYSFEQAQGKRMLIPESGKRK